MWILATLAVGFSSLSAQAQTAAPGAGFQTITNPQARQRLLVSMVCSRTYEEALTRLSGQIVPPAGQPNCRWMADRAEFTAQSPISDPNQVSSMLNIPCIAQDGRTVMANGLIGVQHNMNALQPRDRVATPGRVLPRINGVAQPIDCARLPVAETNFMFTNVVEPQGTGLAYDPAVVATRTTPMTAEEAAELRRLGAGATHQASDMPVRRAGAPTLATILAQQQQDVADRVWSGAEGAAAQAGIQRPTPAIPEQTAANTAAIDQIVADANAAVQAAGLNPETITPSIGEPSSVVAGEVEPLPTIQELYAELLREHAESVNAARLASYNRSILSDRESAED